MAPAAIELIGINKSFGAVHANRDIDLEIAQGTIHGIVNRESLMIAAVTVPGLLLGQMVGTHFFVRIDAKRYRAVSTVCVAMAGLLVVVRGLLSLL